MDKLLTALYEITLSMNQAFKEEEYDEIDKLLNDRNELMLQVDLLKREDAHFQYSKEASIVLEKIYKLDQELTNVLTENLANTKTLLNQSKMNKQVSKKFLPYSNQTSGVFLDAKK